MKTQVRRNLHIPQNHLPERDRCRGSMPHCSMNHWFSVPAIDLRGTYTVEEIARFSPLTGKSARNS